MPDNMNRPGERDNQPRDPNRKPDPKQDKSRQGGQSSEDKSRSDNR